MEGYLIEGCLHLKAGRTKNPCRAATGSPGGIQVHAHRRGLGRRKPPNTQVIDFGGGMTRPGSCVKSEGVLSLKETCSTARTNKRLGVSALQAAFRPHMAMQLLKHAASLGDLSFMPWSQQAMLSDAMGTTVGAMTIWPDMPSQSFCAACACTGEISRPTTAKRYRRVFSMCASQ